MAKVRARKETNNLYLDFSYLGYRCREQTALPDTPSNRKKVEAVLKRVEAQIILDQFDYEKEFPGSKSLKRIKERELQNKANDLPFNFFLMRFIKRLLSSQKPGFWNRKSSGVLRTQRMYAGLLIAP